MRIDTVARALGASCCYLKRGDSFLSVLTTFHAFLSVLTTFASGLYRFVGQKLIGRWMAEPEMMEAIFGGWRFLLLACAGIHSGGDRAAPGARQPRWPPGLRDHRIQGSAGGAAGKGDQAG
jgi:hypothetical protein